MNSIFLFPPQWTPLNPHFSLASLIGQLRKNGYKAEVRDLNAEFYDEILTKDFVRASFDKALGMRQQLFEEISKEHALKKKNPAYSEDFQKKILKYSKIKEIQEKRFDEFNVIPDIIDEAKAIMKCKDRFYSPEFLIRALNVIDKALELISLPYAPSALHFHDYSNPFFKLTFDSIKKQCFDKSTNMYYDYYERVIPSILEGNPEYIGISINSSSQIIPGLTLAMMLKLKTEAHINIGGNFFGRVVEALREKPEFFKLFADSVLVEEGEKPVIELARHLKGEISMEEVPNLVYLSGNEVKVNEKTKPLKLNDLHNVDLTGFPLDLYMTPDIVMPVQSSRGCYWRKCSFCDQDFGQNFNVKDSDKLIRELTELKEKFNVSHFEFIDESVGPGYLEEFSNKLIEQNLQVNWFCNARLERVFSKDLLQLARKAGLKMTLWGFESGSERVMELINKGIDIDKRLEILKDSREADIWNFAYIFFGFPTETWEDALKTMDVICQNTDLISSYGRSVFTLGKHTRLRDDPDKYAITEILENDEEFSPSYEYLTSVGMDAKKISEAAKLCSQKCNEAYGKPLWMYLRYREILFLYVSKLGANFVQNYKLRAL